MNDMYKVMQVQIDEFTVQSCMNIAANEGYPILEQLIPLPNPEPGYMPQALLIMRKLEVFVQEGNPYYNDPTLTKGANNESE